MGDLTSRWVSLAASVVLPATSASATLGRPSDGVGRAIMGAAGSKAGTGNGVATCTAPRCCGLFEMRILSPLSDEISMESTVDSSIISMSFFTYRKSIIDLRSAPRPASGQLDELACELREDPWPG